MKFVKKPVVVEAEQWLGPGYVVEGVQREWVPSCGSPPDGVYYYYVVTAHGHKTTIAPGDWVIAEIDGSGFYPCKDSIFRELYDPVPAEQPKMVVVIRAACSSCGGTIIRDRLRGWQCLGCPQ